MNNPNTVIINGKRVVFNGKGEMFVFPNVPGHSQLTQEQKNINAFIDVTKKSQDDNKKLANLENRLAEIRKQEEKRQAHAAANAAKQSNYNTYDEKLGEEILNSLTDEDFDESVTTNKCGVGCAISGGRSKRKKFTKKGRRKSTKKRKLRKGRKSSKKRK